VCPDITDTLPFALAVCCQSKALEGQNLDEVLIRAKHIDNFKLNNKNIEFDEMFRRFCSGRHWLA